MAEDVLAAVQIAGNEESEKLHTKPYNQEGKLDVRFQHINYIEDVFGRFHLALDSNKGKANASEKLIHLSKMERDGFVSYLKSEVSPHEEFFSRFINYLWSDFLSKVGNNIENNFEIYNQIHREISAAKVKRDIEFWPFSTEEVEKASSF